MQKVYLEKVLENALLLDGEWDYVIVHDPQPAALLTFIGYSSVNRPETKWMWRCHIDLTDAREDVWEFFRPYVERYDASVWTMDQFIPDSLIDGQRHHRAAVHRPAVGEEPRAPGPVRPTRSASSTGSTRTGRSSAR